MMKTSNRISEAGWQFDNSYSRLPETLFSRIQLNRVRAPQLVILNEPLAVALGLDVQALQSEEGIATFAGNRIPAGAIPLAQAYAGHQFGYFTMLGDGRAVLLGEQITPLGERFDIQLKGAGKTPYSRRGDGRAALGPMLREYIISEAMYALGIPTSRSLAVVTTGESIFRESEQAGAILTRVASSHLRVGTFQYLANWGTVDELRLLADYTIERHFPEASTAENRYLSLLQSVIRRQAALIAKWQLVGFIHGVMNTDNMALSGETIDYGPCAFMDAYDPATVFSSIDRNGRYAYGNQPPIAAWNLARFAETLLPLLDDNRERAVQLAQDTLTGFFTFYQQFWLAGMRAKLGIDNEEAEDEALMQELLDWMQKQRADYTNTFLALTFDQPEAVMTDEAKEFIEWKKRWQARLGRNISPASRQQLMRASNPALIPRNHRVEAALEAAVQGDYRVIKKLLDVLANPYAHTPDQAAFADPAAPSACRYQTFCGT